MEETPPERRRSSVVPGQLREALTRKAHDLFSLCDKEGKGFVNKKDMQRLHDELPLEPDQLEVVFDSLDTDGNGFLTLEEFTGGFGKFLGYDKEPRRMSCFVTPQQESSTQAESKNVEEDDEQFEDFLDSLGSPTLLKEEEYVKNTWMRLRQEDPTMLGHFEDFLTKVTSSIKNNETECTSLGQALLQRKIEQDKQVECLYEEMENQLKIEKEQLLAQEQQKEKRLREELEAELQHKEQLLQEVMTKHEELERQLKNLNSNEAETKQENARLLKELQKLDRRLHDSESAVEDTQRRLESLQQISIDEKRRRAKNALQVTQNIALEREDLVKQLEMLRTTNKELLDQKDEINLLASANLHAAGGKALSTHTTVGDEDDTCKLTQEGSPSEHRRGSRISDYIEIRNLDPTLVPVPVYEEEDYEVDDSYFERTHDPPIFLGAALSHGIRDGGDRKSKVRPRSRSCEFRTTSSKGSDEERSESGRGDSLTSLPTSMDNEHHVSARRVTSSTERGEVEGGATTPAMVQPERVFKVVMVGDSAVGKTCFINRFCKDTFVDVFRATVGVDFQVKSVSVRGRPVALQMWDTAGQERFRSITKQYYRKADGVIIIYDVCSEHSFYSVRSWASVLDQEGVKNNVVLMLLGNKVDLISSACQRAVSHSEGEKLAHEIGAQFYETSAKSGENVVIAMEHMASILKIREDEEIDKALRLNALEVDSSRKRCC